MKHEIIRPILSVWLKVFPCLVIYCPHTASPLGDDLGGRDSHHHRLHSGWLHHAGLGWSLLHRWQPKHSWPARLPGQQQLHGLSERCEYCLTSAWERGRKIQSYPPWIALTLLISRACSAYRKIHLILILILLLKGVSRRNVQLSSCVVQSICIYRFLRESPGKRSSNIQIKQMHLLMLIPETQSELFRHYFHVLKLFNSGLYLSHWLSRARKLRSCT